MCQWGLESRKRILSPEGFDHLLLEPKSKAYALRQVVTQSSLIDWKKVNLHQREVSPEPSRKILNCGIQKRVWQMRHCKRWVSTSVSATIWESQRELDKKHTRTQSSCGWLEPTGRRCSVALYIEYPLCHSTATSIYLANVTYWPSLNLDWHLASLGAIMRHINLINKHYWTLGDTALLLFIMTTWHI